jgi:hypothetical protein
VRDPDLPPGWILDPLCEQVGAPRYWWVITDEGVRTSWNGEDVVKCPVCHGSREAMPSCEECVGRGRVDHIPFAPRPWDEVIPGLWLGGHDCQPDGAPPKGECFLEGADFDVVVSLFQRWDPRYSPGLGVEHHTHRMADADLDPEHHTTLDDLANVVAHAAVDGRKVLVRCQAGLNRSALVMGLALIRLGWTADNAIRMMRQARSPYVLCNESFVAYLREVDQ